jgi:membrane protease YdiL (CAAX protease family)
MNDIEAPGAPTEIRATTPGAPRRALHLLLAIFWSGDERRVRALWRIVALGLLVSGGWLAIRATGLLPERGTREFYIVGSIIRVLLVLAVMGLVGRLLDRRRLRDFGLSLDRGWWLDLSFGLVLGAGMMTMVFLAEWGLGWVVVTGTFRTPVAGEAFGRAILMPAILFLVVGIVEELVARGYLLRNLAEGLSFRRLGGARGGLILATATSSILFGLAHLGNPNANWVSTVNIAFAGVLLALGLLLTGRLAVPIGMHITWNFFQASVFGFAVSGVAHFRTTFIATDETGPDLWTGGVFGPEAGLLGLAAMVASAGLIALWVRWRTGEVRLVTALAEPPSDRPRPSATV